MRAAIGAAITVTDTTIELTSVKTDAINLDVLRLDRLHVAASDLLEDQQANIVPAGQAGGIEPAPLSCEQGNRKLPRLRFTFRSFTSTAGSESSTGATAFTPLSG